MVNAFQTIVYMDPSSAWQAGVEWSRLGCSIDRRWAEMIGEGLNPSLSSL